MQFIILIQISSDFLTIVSFLILQEEIVDETDEYVDVHKRYVSSLQELLAPGILQLLLSILHAICK